MRWKRYTAYKDSGVEWLGEVPEHWDEYSLRWCVEEINTNVEADDMLYIGLEHIESWTGKVHSVDQVSEVISGKHFLPGDVLFGRLRPYLAKGFVADEEGICSGELLVLRPNGMNRFYLHFLLLSPGFVGCVDSSTYGAKMPRASWEFIRKLVIPVPSIGEQERIASFIEVQTCGIDTLISKKQRQLELLEEKRTALITHAVTKGLDPNVKMKDSGVEWLGKVPENWDVVSFRRVCRLQQGLQIAQDQRFAEPGPNRHRYITIKSIHSGDRSAVEEYIENPVSRVLCMKSDVLLARTGATAEVVTGEEGVFHNNFFKIVYDAQKIASDYLVFFLKNRNVKEHLLMLAGTTTIPDLNHDDFLSSPFLQPPVGEQLRIVSCLRNKLSKVDLLIDEITNSVLTIQEYRSALISAAVTGQIDVREEVV